MPELPEVETVRRGLAPWLTGARIETVLLNRADLRFPFPAGFAQALAGATVAAVGRRAKYLLFELSTGGVWLAHLGMTGSFLLPERAAAPERYHPVAAPAKHAHALFTLSHPEHGALSLIYADPRRFGFMDVFAPGAPNRYLDALGPEPLGNSFGGPVLLSALSGRAAPIKAALLDQKIVAGLGNIYVSEALHRAHISPFRPARSLGEAEAEELAAAIRQVLEEAIASGGSTLSDFRDAAGAPGYFQHGFAVYDREGAPCPREGCPGTIERAVQAGRSSFFCPRCQR